MTQAERDRLVALKKAKKKLITQKQAAEELGITERHVRRLLRELKRRGDKIVAHGLRGLPSHRKISADTEQEAVAILSQPVYRGFGPTLAAEYLAKKHDIEVSRETVRQWMTGAKLWRPRRQRIEKVHEWRPRRSRFGELVQWDTSDHDWLEGRGEEILLINMIDDATSRWFARFVSSDSTVENMNLLERYVKEHGRPLAYYTDKAALFQTAVKTKRDESRAGKDRAELPPTQIGRALQELNIEWIAAHSPQAKGRIERSFKTAQDRLVKGLRRVGAKDLKTANAYLEQGFMPLWNERFRCQPQLAGDAHRAVPKGMNLDSVLSIRESRTVTADYTVRWQGVIYRVEREQVRVGMRGARVQLERWRDGSRWMRWRNRTLALALCESTPRAAERLVKREVPAVRSAEEKARAKQRRLDGQRH